MTLDDKPQTTRAKLLAAANDVLAHDSGTAFDLDTIAHAAGVPPAVARQDVGSAEDLLHLVALSHLQSLHGKINATTKAVPPKDWDGVFQILMNEAMVYGLENPAVVQLFLGTEGWQIAKDLTHAAEDEMAAQMAEMLPEALWAPVAKLDRGLNSFRLVIDMIITLFQTDFQESGTLNFEIMVEAKRVAVRYLSAIDAEAQALDETS